MRAVIATTFFDTPDNRRSDVTIRVLQRMHQTLDERHIIVPVDNGSVNLASWHWICEMDYFPHAIRIEEPMSISQGVNSAWRPWESELLTGDMVAVKWDSDMLTCPADWLNEAWEILEANPTIGLIGPRMEGVKYTDTTEFEGWMETQFIHGGMCMRSPVVFKAIGYCRQPLGKWGWGDHWDVFRAKQAALRLAVLTRAETFAIAIRSALPKDYKDGHIELARHKLLEMEQEVLDGKRDVYEPYDGVCIRPHNDV